MQCIYFSALQLIVIFIIPAIPTFGEREVMHPGFLCFGSQHWDLCISGVWDGELGFFQRFCRSVAVVPQVTLAADAEHVSDVPGASRGAGDAGEADRALVPPLPSFCSSLPPRRITASSSIWGNCVIFLFFFSTQKLKKRKHGISEHFCDFSFPADEETVALCPSWRAGWM